MALVHEISDVLDADVELGFFNITERLADDDLDGFAPGEPQLWV